MPPAFAAGDLLRLPPFIGLRLADATLFFFRYASHFRLRIQTLSRLPDGFFFTPRQICRFAAIF
jgi:hypothetical protein